MVACMDEAVHNVTNALKTAGLWENTVLIFSTGTITIIYMGKHNSQLAGHLKFELKSCSEKKTCFSNQLQHGFFQTLMQMKIL